MKWLLFFLIIPFCAKAQIITTVVGGGTLLGDGGPATAALIDDPTQINFDKKGNLYIATGFGSRIRKVDTAGIITTVAGTGTAGYSGDNGLATFAQINFGAGVAIDSTGNIFISDGHYGAIRRVDAITHRITTVCGNDIMGYSGDGGPATAAKLYGPSAICFDKTGNLYIADENNNVVRKIDGSGVIHTIAGTGVYGFNGDGIQATNAKLYLPIDVQVDDAGNLYIADQGNYRIRKVDKFGIISTYAGNGIGTYIGDGMAATNAQFVPTYIKFNSTGDLFVSDQGINNKRVYKIDHNTGKFHIVAGNGNSINAGDGGLATAASFSGYPAGIAFDLCDNLFIGNVGISQDSDRIRKVTFNPSPCGYLEIKETIIINSITVYPNPFLDELHIELKTSGQYILLNITGIIEQTGTLKEGSNSVPVGSLPAGLHMLVLIDEEGRKIVEKIVKE